MKVSVPDLLTDYEDFSERLESDQIEIQKLINARSYIANHFPFSENAYQYLPITKTALNMDDKLSELEPLQNSNKLRQFKLGYDQFNPDYNPYIDDRLYSIIPPEVPAEIKKILHSFKASVSRSRFAVLKAGHQIKEHVDNNLDHSVRIHIPLVTSDECVFGVRRRGVVETKNLPADGSVYFVNTAFPHFVSNQGPVDRIHLIINLNGLEDIEHLKFEYAK